MRDGAYTDYDRLEIDLEDPSLAKIVLRLRLFKDTEYDQTDNEYDKSIVAGTLSAMGAGVWSGLCNCW